MIMDDENPPRRTILRSIGASAAAIGGATQASGSSDPEVAQPEIDELEVEEVTGDKWRNGIEQAFANQRYREIYDEFKSQGMNAKIRESDVMEVTENNGSQRYVVVTPFRTPSGDKKIDEAYTLYTGIEIRVRWIDRIS